MITPIWIRRMCSANACGSGSTFGDGSVAKCLRVNCVFADNPKE